MNFVFKPARLMTIPDGTELQDIVSPRVFQTHDLPFFTEMSTALGTLPAGVESSIHLHPIVNQLTFVTCGQVTVKMKDASLDEPYSLTLSAGESVLTRAGTFFQLINSTDSAAQALYIVTPCFVFEMDGNGNVWYNDAIVMDLSWDDLKHMNWEIPQITQSESIKEKRLAALRRLRQGNSDLASGR